MGPNVEIKITEMPRTEKDKLEDELFCINLALDLYLEDYSRLENSDKVIRLTKRKKEIEERLKLIELEKDF